LKIKPHIISIHEAWLYDNQQGDFNSLFDYTFVSNYRKEHKGGGVALHIKNEFSFYIRQSEIT